MCDDGDVNVLVPATSWEPKQVLKYLESEDIFVWPSLVQWLRVKSEFWGQG